MLHQGSAAPAREESRRHRERVPVEHRFGGLDRRSFVPALVVVGIWLLWAVALPHLDGAIDHDDNDRDSGGTDGLAVGHHRA